MNLHIQRAAFFVLVALSILATVRVLKKKGPVTDDPTLTGAWAAAERRLDLREDGKYVVVTADSAGTLSVAECGRWRSLEGDFQMRVRWQQSGPVSRPILLSNPGLRAGTAATRDDELALHMKSAKPGAQAAVEEIWLMHRAPSALPALNETESRWLERACDMGSGG